MAGKSHQRCYCIVIQRVFALARKIPLWQLKPEEPLQNLKTTCASYLCLYLSNQDKRPNPSRKTFLYYKKWTKRIIFDQLCPASHVCFSGYSAQRNFVHRLLHCFELFRNLYEIILRIWYHWNLMYINLLEGASFLPKLTGSFSTWRSVRTFLAPAALTSQVNLSPDVLTSQVNLSPAVLTS